MSKMNVLHNMFLAGLACAATCAGIAIAAEDGDVCVADSHCGFFACHAQMCNCCPTVGNNDITWECVQGGCDQQTDDPSLGV